MTDWSDDDDCCLNCESRICNRGRWCDHCLCQSCDYHEFDRNNRRGYCSLVHDSAGYREDDEDEEYEDDDDDE